MLKFVNSHLQYLQNQLGISGLMVLEGSLFVAPLTENIFIWPILYLEPISHNTIASYFMQLPSSAHLGSKCYGPGQPTSMASSLC
jgi:hypothetical protein